MEKVTLADIRRVSERIFQTALVKRTPLWKASFKCQRSEMAPIGKEPRGTSVPILLKLENLQVTGSYKIRGVLNFFHEKRAELSRDEGLRLVTMSAGNYGKSFATIIEKFGAEGVVCMPDTAPSDRKELIERFKGVTVETTPSSNLLNLVREYEERGYTFAHPFDDPLLHLGYGSIGLEILEQMSELGLEELSEQHKVVVPCGGGGVLAGVSRTLRLAGFRGKIIGVEPEAAPGHFVSRQKGEPVSISVERTIAAGLAPPFAGKKCYEVITETVDDLVLVSDEEIKEAMRCLFDEGLVVEPSGAAALAAVITGRVAGLEEGQVVCLVSGRNVAAGEFEKLVRR